VNERSKTAKFLEEKRRNTLAFPHFLLFLLFFYFFFSFLSSGLYLQKSQALIGSRSYRHVSFIVSVPDKAQTRLPVGNKPRALDEGI
jgi:hypothetical protein